MGPSPLTAAGWVALWPGLGLGRHACRKDLQSPLPLALYLQAQSNVGALGWRLTQGDVAELDELAIEGSLKFGQHG